MPAAGFTTLAPLCLLLLLIWTRLGVSKSSRCVRSVLHVKKLANEKRTKSAPFSERSLLTTSCLSDDSRPPVRALLQERLLGNSTADFSHEGLSCFALLLLR